VANFPLLEDEINRFDEQGFIKVENFINQAQVAELAYYYDRAVTGEIHVPPAGSNHIKGRMVQHILWGGKNMSIFCKPGMLPNN
jgi:hypothetical protein